MRNIRNILFVASFALVLSAMIMSPAAGQTAYNQRVLADNPAYYWTFDEVGVVNAVEQVNGLAEDEFVPGENSLKAASTTAPDGVSLGQAAQIVETGGYPWNVADLSGGGMAGAYAYEVWANADDVTTYEYMVGSHAGSGFNTATIFKWGPGGEPAGIQLYSGGGVLGTGGGAAAVTPGWHHYVFVSDGVTADYDTYVDGVFAGTATSGVNAVPHPETQLKLGSWTDGESAETFDGLLDELAIYDLDGVANLSAAGQAIARHFDDVAPPEPGDFNDDMMIDSVDAGILRDHLNAHLDGDVGFEDGDMDGNRRVDLVDFALFLKVFPGAADAGTVVPEPSSVALSLFAWAGLVAVARRRGR